MSRNDRFERIPVEVGEVLKTTDLAALCEIDGEEVWLPWSQLESQTVESEGDCGTVWIPRWLAEEKCLD